MTRLASTTALMAAQTLPAASDGVAPEWVHLLPAGEIQTADRRGPYRVSNAQQLIALSFADDDRLPIDENHSTDLAAPRGEPAPARGWITAMESRADGIWGRVEWNATGAELVTGRAYRALSPVIRHDTKNNIGRILRASLVNKPNLRGLTALNQESEMTLLERLAELLGIETPDEDNVVAAVTTLHAAEADAATALQSQLSEIGVALGVAQDADAKDILAAAKARKAGGIDQTAITALQSEITTLTTELNTVKEVAARSKAEVFVDGEIKRGRAGVKPLRDHYIAMHMEDAARVEKELNALPVLGNSGTTVVPPVKEGEIALNAEQIAAANLIGLPLDDYKKTLSEEAL